MNPYNLEIYYAALLPYLVCVIRLLSWLAIFMIITYIFGNFPKKRCKGRLPDGGRCSVMVQDGFFCEDHSPWWGWRVLLIITLVFIGFAIISQVESCRSYGQMNDKSSGMVIDLNDKNDCGRDYTSSLIKNGYRRVSNSDTTLMRINYNNIKNCYLSIADGSSDLEIYPIPSYSRILDYNQFLDTMSHCFDKAYEMQDK